MKEPIIFILLFFLSLPLVKGQCDTVVINRLDQSILSLTDSFDKADTLNELAWEWKTCNLQKALSFADSAELLSSSLEYPKGLADNYMIRALIAEMDLNFIQADSFYHKALKIRIKLGNQTNVAKVYNNLGALYVEFGSLEKGVAFYEKGLLLFNGGKELVPTSSRVKAKFHNNLGNAYQQIGDYENSLENFEKSLNIRRENNNRHGMALVHLNIGALFYEDSFRDTFSSRKHLDTSLLIFNEFNDLRNMAKCYLNQGNLQLKREQFEQAYSFYQKALNLRVLSRINQFKVKRNIASIYFQRKNYQVAIDTFLYCLEAFNSMGNEVEVAKIHLDVGNAFYEIGEYKNALNHLHKSLGLFEEKKFSKYKVEALEDLSNTYNQLGQSQKAFNFSNTSLQLLNELAKDLQEATNYRVELADEKKKTVESEFKIANLKKEKEINKIYITSLALMMFLGTILSVVGFLAYYNRKKRQLAEKNVILAKQEVDVLVNAQALKTTFARLEGVEQERKRIAKELHDRIGVMLSTAKLYFAPMDAQLTELPEKDQNKYKKATDILDEAYSEVRRISHNMASPSIINLGLVKELELLASRIEEAKQLKVKVEAHGMEERLNNNIEIGLYRIIQELVTNALKHAHASEINIQLNHFDDLVNVIVEDNGVGFDQSRVNRNQMGVGLKNIASRLSDLGGSYTIDSGIGRGTSTTLDIPLKI